jgi:uncharacterized protein YbaR (Trm112 family)
MLAFATNPVNPSGVIVVQKSDLVDLAAPAFQCPLTATPLSDAGDVYASESTGLIYPVLRGIPMLRPEHVIVASRLDVSARTGAVRPT